MRTGARLNSWGLVSKSVLLLMREHTTHWKNREYEGREYMVLLRDISGAFPLRSSLSGKEATALSANKSCFGLSVWPRVRTDPLMLLNELMMPQEMDFKDASAGSRITCAVYKGPFPSYNAAPPAPHALVDTSLCSEIVCRVELLSPSYGMRLCWEGSTERYKRGRIRSRAYWVVSFQWLSETIDFLPHFRLCVLWHPSLT